MLLKRISGSLKYRFLIARNRFFAMLEKSESVYEKWRGWDFSTVRSLNEGKDEYIYYTQSSPFSRITIAKYLRGKITKEDAIIDLGCGKGRMLYFFSKFPFKKVCGLEYSQEMIDIAKKNMQILRRGGVLIIQGDAKTFTDYDDYNYFYLFNPFTGSIMLSCLRHIKESVSRKPRKIHIIYRNPIEQKMFLAEGFKLGKELLHDVYFWDLINVFTF